MLIMNLDELEARRDWLRTTLVNLQSRAESGEDYAYLCDLYADLDEVEAEYAREVEANSQFGVGA